jgi:hypothetical protein
MQPWIVRIVYENDETVVRRTTTSTAATTTKTTISFVSPTPHDQITPEVVDSITTKEAAATVATQLPTAAKESASTLQPWILRIVYDPETDVALKKHGTIPEVVESTQTKNAALTTTMTTTRPSAKESKSTLQPWILRIVYDPDTDVSLKKRTAKAPPIPNRTQKVVPLLKSALKTSSYHHCQYHHDYLDDARTASTNSSDDEQEDAVSSLGSTSPTLRPNSNRRRRNGLSVSFCSTMTVQLYATILGDNPSTSSGPPLSLGRAVGPPVTLPLLNDNESLSSGPPRATLSDLIIPRHCREQLLLALGYTQDDLDTVTNKIRFVQLCRHAHSKPPGRWEKWWHGSDTDTTTVSTMTDSSLSSITTTTMATF